MRQKLKNVLERLLFSVFTHRETDSFGLSFIDSFNRSWVYLKVDPQVGYGMQRRQVFYDAIGYLSHESSKLHTPLGINLDKPRLLKRSFP